MSDKLRSKVLRFTNIPKEECDRYFGDDKLPMTLAAKELYLREGEVCREMGFIEKGTMRMYYVAADGEEINVDFFFENDFATSYQSFITQTPGKYFIQALTDCELTTVSHASLQHAYANSPQWQQFGRIIAERVFIRAEQRKENLMFYDAEERYQNLLATRPKIFEQVPLYHIASYLGIKRESLSRLRKKLAGKE